MRRRLVGNSYIRVPGRGMAVAALAWFGFVAAAQPVAMRVNTGMADPVALVNAYDRFAASARAGECRRRCRCRTFAASAAKRSTPADGCTVDLTTGAVDSFVDLLPPDASFDLWLIDNRPGPGHTTLAEDGRRPA